MRYVNDAVALLVLSAMLFTGAACSKTQENPFTRQQMLENIADEIIVPLQLSFVDQTVVFQEAAYAFRENPSAETLENLQQEWRSTSYLWEKVDIFRLGQITLIYHSQVDNGTPVSVEDLEERLAGDGVIDTSSVAGSGSNLKGLRTIEYLLFDSYPDNEAILNRYTTDLNSERRMQYLVAAVDALHLNALEIWNYWSPDDGNYVAEFIEADDGSSAQESISMLANTMMAALEHVVQMNIGVTIGGNLGKVDPAYVTSPYAGYSLEQMRSNLEIIHQTFNGDGENEKGVGFDDYLNFLNANYEDRPLSLAINQQLTLFLDNLNSVDHAMLIDDPSLIEPIYAEGIRSLVLLKVDMVAHMGITITFSDNDGD